MQITALCFQPGRRGRRSPAVLVARRHATAEGLQAELRVAVLRWVGWRPRWGSALRATGRVVWRVDADGVEVAWDAGAVVVRAPLPRGSGGRLAVVTVASTSPEWAWLSGRHLGLVSGGVQPAADRHAPRWRLGLRLPPATVQDDPGV